MTTSYSSMGNEEVRQPQRGEVVIRSMGIRPMEGLLSRGIRDQGMTPSSLEVVLVLRRSISWHDGLAEGLMGNCQPIGIPYIDSS